jgi:2-polyprenyl-3-methyl-5-hydroxy-6-metoxy-1,4-benzoquinol methylase
MAKRGAEVLGVDANALAIDYALQTFSRQGGASFRKGFLDELSLERESFDKAVCLEVIEHVYPNQVQKLFSDLFEILKKGGHLYVTTPNYRGLWPIVEWAADRFSPVAKMDAEQHVTHFNNTSLRNVLRQTGFEVIDIRTFSTFAPFVSPLSWRTAERLENMERKANLPFGSVLAAVARKP